ncbi:hypothetical protein [Pseudoxanthomonas sacheonensis]|uniref:Uncharacterized protein n=1 Tax=Pseudoxanthomonas sacheonensis TaxID=443615 RepID=A0ABU1RU70_9GAMM|nr:hypothetical protein [Pseudoxanthomonas sacheonensis]MDR6842318.1 hypothetical protein [Pseudoxanthomonas sacheonensis]
MRKFLAAFPVLMLLASPQAHAITQAEAEKIAANYLASLPPADVSYDAIKTVIGDLDGDGKPEIAVQTALLGPTYWSYRLDVFVDRGKGYAHAGTSELWGDVQSIAIDKGMVVVKSKMLAPNDPRCCPTLEKTYRYVWKGGKVIEAK